MNAHEARVILEAALLTAQQPLSLADIGKLLGDEFDTRMLQTLLDELQQSWQGRGVELVRLASGWCFQSTPAMRGFLDRLNPDKPARYSRAVLETLAIIAYRQPVTRGDVEEVRGVAVSPPTLNALIERGWVEIVGTRETPGRPAIFATTRKFLDDLNLRSLEELPPLEDLQSALETAGGGLVALEAAAAPPDEEAPQDSPEEESNEPQTPESSEQA